MTLETRPRDGLPEDYPQVPASPMPEPTVADREQLRLTFDSAADLYQQARPEYPESLFDALIDLTGIQPGAHLLEIGCATGKATLPLARRGFKITCIELGPDLAAAARNNLAAFPLATVIDGAFETWRPLTTELFDLVFAATAWHWIDPELRYGRAWELLRPSGHLAFWSATHVIPETGDPFFADIQSVYDEIGESLPDGWVPLSPGQLPDSRAEIEASGLFDPVTSRQFDWELSYDAEQYIRLLDTFSGHINMKPWQRDRLYSEINRRLALRPDGKLRRHWGVVMDIARRRDQPTSPHTNQG